MNKLHLRLILVCREVIIAMYTLQNQILPYINLQLNSEDKTGSRRGRIYMGMIAEKSTGFYFEEGVWIRDIWKYVKINDGREAVVSAIIDISSHVDRERVLFMEAQLDPLTGIYN